MRPYHQFQCIPSPSELGLILLLVCSVTRILRSRGPGRYCVLWHGPSRDWCCCWPPLKRSNLNIGWNEHVRQWTQWTSMNINEQRVQWVGYDKSVHRTTRWRTLAQALLLGPAAAPEVLAPARVLMPYSPSMEHLVASQSPLVQRVLVMLRRKLQNQRVWNDPIRANLDHPLAPLPLALKPS